MGDSIMLVCAVLASLASGVVAAYAVCVTFFSIFRTGQRSGERSLRSKAGAAKAAVFEG